VNDRGPAPAPLGDLDVRTLRYFVAVAEELNFTRAAERLFVAQQAISRDIRKLERRLGTTLFDRTTRRVSLTPDGERLLVEARELLAVHDRIVGSRLPAGRPVHVDLMSDGRLTGPRFLQALRTAAPSLEFRGRYGGAMGASMRRLEAGELDIAIGRADWRGRRPTRSIRTRALRHEPLALLLPAAHPLAALDAVPVARLAGQEVDANAATPDATEWLDLGEQFLVLAGAISTPPHEAAIGADDQSDHLVRQGLPILSAIDHVAVPGGVVRPIVEPIPIYVWSVAWRAKADRAVVTALEAAVETLTTDTDWLATPDGAWLPEPEASARPQPPRPADRGTAAATAPWPGRR
jgi:DNA-binding transcriptional LysR family regulator